MMILSVVFLAACGQVKASKPSPQFKADSTLQGLQVSVNQTTGKRTIDEFFLYGQLDSIEITLSGTVSRAVSVDNCFRLQIKVPEGTTNIRIHNDTETVDGEPEFVNGYYSLSVRWYDRDCFYISFRKNPTGVQEVLAKYFVYITKNLTFVD